MRTLFLIAAIVLVFLIARLLLRRARLEGQKPARVQGPEKMVRCTNCGLHVPEREAIRSPDGEPYCSDEHRRLGPGK